MGLMQIQPLSDGDIDAVIALWRECNLTRPWNNPSGDIDLARKNKSSEILVGLVDDGLVASVMCGFDGHRGWLYYVAVRPDLQGKGYGRQITNAAEEWLRKQGAPKVELMIRDDNVTVRNFYEHAGYAIEPRAVMAKWLIEPPIPQSE